MVVKLDAVVVADGVTWMTGFGDDAQTGKRIERAVNGGAGDAWDLANDRIENLVSRGMIVEVENRIEDGAPLKGNRDPVLPAFSREQIETFFFGEILHDSDPRPESKR